MTEQTYVPVGQVMSQQVHTVDSMATIREAVGLLAEHNVSSLVIERRDHHDEYGIIQLRDIAERVIAQNHSPDRVQVYEIMSKPVLTLPAEMNIKYGIRHLVEFNRTRAVVIDHDRKLLGIVSLRDMVLRYAQSDV